MRNLKLIPITILLHAAALLSLQAQHEYDVWHFGLGFGLDFRSGTPVYLPLTPVNTLESSADICDRNTGEFLFAAGGGVVYNRDGMVMPNGRGIIDGDYTSAQGEIILPDPCDSLRYYIFTADQAGYVVPNRGINYSIVDLRADGGRGDVVALNIPLMPKAWEYLTAVMHSNGHDYWVIAHSNGDRMFYAWRVTEQGVSPTPVQSVVGTDLGVSPFNGRYPLGQLKASPDGRHLACAGMFMALLELYDFDPATGVVSNARQLHGPGSGDRNDLYYGLSFSPDSRLLYAGANTIVYTDYWLGQWDITLPDLTSIQASLQVASTAASRNNDALLGMQIGPDGKIYVVMGHGGIGVIEKPNERGTACTFTPNVYMTAAPGNNSTDRIMSLPNNIDDYRFHSRPRPADPVRIEGVVYGMSCTQATITIADRGSAYRNISWSTGDTGRSVLVNTPGHFVVTAVDTMGCTSFDSLDVTAGIAVSIDGDTTLCGDSIAILVAHPAGNAPRVLWSTGDTTLTIAVHETGTYTVVVYGVGGCEASDTVTVTPGFSGLLEGRINQVTAAPGDTVTMTLRLDRVLNYSSSGRLDIRVTYDASLLRPLLPEYPGESAIELAGTTLDGWLLTTQRDDPGDLVLTAEPGTVVPLLSAPSILLRLRFATYLTAGRSIDSPLVTTVTADLDAPGVECIADSIQPGGVLFELCGLSLRLIDATGESYSLDDIRPNPASSTAEVSFSIGLDGPTRLDLIDEQGRIAAVLLDRDLTAGRYHVTWETTGRPSGRYLLRIISGDWKRVKTLLLAR